MLAAIRVAAGATPLNRIVVNRNDPNRLAIATNYAYTTTDAKLVDLSGDVPTPPGGGFPTEEQVLELRAKGAKNDPAAPLKCL